MAEGSKIRLTIPRQDLAAFSHFPLTTKGAQEWADNLPVASTQKAAELLHQALSDLNHSGVAPELRYEILELLRPPLDTALSGLQKRYLNQPLVMPGEPARMAVLAADLLRFASTAYTLVAVETIQRRESIRENNPARLACDAINSALAYAGRSLLLVLQLYKPLPVQGWQKMHQLYALAEEQDLQELPVQEIGFGGTCIRATYLQALLLSRCKPNQLRESDLGMIYHAMAHLAGFASLEEPNSSNGLFVVDLSSDQPPLYSGLRIEPPDAGCRVISTQGLITKLRQLRSDEEDAAQADDTDALPPHLIEHLIESLGSMSQRNFTRTPSNSSLNVCLGFSNTHYHVAGRTEFEDLLNTHNPDDQTATAAPEQANLQSPDKAEAWSHDPQALHYRNNEWSPGQPEPDDSDTEYATEILPEEIIEEVEATLPLDQRYPVFEVQLTDASPGGYCLKWNEELPADVHSGDIVCLQEEQSEGWVIAAIRWLSQLPNSHTLIGLELLSPRAMAFAAQIHNRDGSTSAPMRVLLLPEIKLVGQPPTLITPRASFRERQRLTLINGEDSESIQLLRQVTTTGSFIQFEFRYTQALRDVLEAQGSALDSPYDSLWSNI